MRHGNLLSTALLVLFATLATLMVMVIARDPGSFLPSGATKVHARMLPAAPWRKIPANAWGCRLGVSLPQGPFAGKDPIRPRLVLTNGSPDPVTIWVSTFAANHRVEVRDADGNEPPLTELGERARASFAPRGGRDKNHPIVIPAGGQHDEEASVDLRQHYRLGVGRYRATITYHDEQGPTPMKIVSNSTPFEVR